MSRAKLRTFTLRICKHPVDRSPEFVNTSEVAYRGQTLLHIHEVFVLGDVVFVVNGGLVERLDWDSTVVRPRDIVDAVPNVGWIWAALTWAFWNVAVPLIISYGLSYLGGELFGADAEESEDRFEGVNHAWNPRTTQREGLVRPRAYGESMQHGNITASWTDTEDDNEILYAIIDHGEGPVEGLGSNILYIEDQPAGNFSGVTVIERNGTIPQTVMPGFEKTKIEYTLNWDLTSAIGEKTFTTPNNFFDDLEYTIAFPGGLVEIDEEDGDLNGYGVTLEVEISERGLNSWTTVQYQQIARATRDAVYINHKLSDMPSGYTFFCERGKQYDLKFRRITGPGSSNVLDDSYLKSVREVIDTAFTHPGRAMLGVTALATGQLHGTSPDFKCIRKGRIVAVYNGTSWSLEYSPLTAWVVYDAVTQPIITGTGESGDPFVIARYDGVHPDNLDTAFFYEWAQLCDYQVDDGKDGTESQFTCNFNLDTERSVFSLAYELAQVARATLYWEGNILTGWLDDDVTTIEDLITVDNVVAKSWKNSWGGKTDRAGSSTVFYRDGENGFERTSIKVSNAQAGSYKSAISVEASGETRRSGAIRYGHFLMEKNARIKNMNTFDVLKDAMRWKLGEVVRVQCMTAGWGEGYRILSTESDGRTLVLDRPIENVQADDTIYIRTYDEVELEVNNSSYTVYCVDGSTITVTTDLDPLPGRHNILAATTSTTARTSTPVLRRIVGLKQRSDGFYAVTVQTYDAALYGASPPVENPNTSPVWAAPAKSQGLEPRPINYTSLITAIKNSVPILGGSLSITWKGEFASPPADPITNWVYRNTTDDIVYIYDGDSWEEMVYDGDDGAAGATGDTGDNGLSVFITYHDNEADNAPSTPTGDGTTGGWHTAVTNDVVWFSQKVAESASTGTWGTPLRISGTAIWSEVIDDGAKPSNYADVAADNPIATFREAFVDPHGTFVDRWDGDIGIGNCSVVAVSDAVAGGKVMRCGDNSGNDESRLRYHSAIPFDSSKLYRLRVRVRRPNGTGTFYAGLVGRNHNNTEFVNAIGANALTAGHWVVTVGVSPGTGWTEYTGYLKGTGATGSQTAHADPSDPGVLHEDARYFCLLLIMNHTIEAGITEVDEFSVDIIPEDADQLVEGTTNKFASESGADVTADNQIRTFYENFANPNDDIVARWGTGAGDAHISVVAEAGVAGGNILRLGDNSGNDRVSLLYYKPIAFDPSAMYRIRLRARQTAGAGTFYVGLQGYAVDGTTIVNPSGCSSHWFVACAKSLSSSWEIITAYLYGNSAAGDATEHLTVADPAKMIDTAAYFALEIYANFSAEAGQVDIDEIYIDSIPEDADQIAESDTKKWASETGADKTTSTPTEIPWVLNCQWSQESNGTIHWDSRDGVNSIQLAYQGTVYDIVDGSTTDEFVYWDKAYTTVFSHNSSISVALAAENWLLCGVVSGIAYPTTPLQFVHAGVLLAGTIRAESYAELRQTMPWTGQDSCDAAYPYTFDFKIPSELEALISIKLSFKIREYRAYATGAAAGGQQTSGDGGSGVFDTTGAANWPIGADPTTKSSGEGDGATGSDSADYTGYENLGSHTHAMPSHSHDISGDTENADGTGSHDHDLSSFNVDCSSEDPGDTYAKDLSTHRHTAVDHTHSTPAHSHSMAKSELAHDHGLTLTDHTHSVADHQHDITYGIHEESGSPTVNVHIDNGAGFGASIGAYGASQTDIDILAHFSGAGWKSIRFNPDVRCRVSVILEVKLDITA